MKTFKDIIRIIWGWMRDMYALAEMFAVKIYNRNRKALDWCWNIFVVLVVLIAGIISTTLADGFSRTIGALAIVLAAGRLARTIINYNKK